MRFRLSRKRYTVSAPTIRMAPSLPWPFGWLLIAVVLGCCALAAYWVFEFGLSVTGIHPSSAKEIVVLRQELETLKAQQQASALKPTPDSLLLAERTTQTKLIERVKQLEDENQALLEDLRFYEKLIPTNSKENLAIRGLVADRITPQQLRWQLLLIQPTKDAPQVNLQIEVVATGILDGKSWTSAPADGRVTQSVQQSKRLSGTIPIPDKVVLKSVSVKVSEGKALRGTQSLNL